MEDRDERQRDVNARVSAHIPPDMVDSAVPIVIAHDGAVHQWGTGTLFRVGDYHFLVTAAHVVKDACSHGKTLGIGGAPNGRFIALTGNAIVCSDDHDRLDVALYHLPSNVLPRLSQARFLQLHDIDFGEQSPTAVNSLLGFPAAWSSPSTKPEEALRLKALQYTAFRYNRDTATPTTSVCRHPSMHPYTRLYSFQAHQCLSSCCHRGRRHQWLQRMARR